MARRRRIGWAAAGAGTGLALWLAAGAVLCETAVHVPKRATPETTFAGASRSDAQISASDGAVLRGWLFTPAASNGNVVMVLHGISDSRAGVMGWRGFSWRITTRFWRPTIAGMARAAEGW